jgi:hypothetical protein
MTWDLPALLPIREEGVLRMLLVVLFRIISCFVDSPLSFLIHMFMYVRIITAPIRIDSILVNSVNISFEASLVM